MLQITKNNIQGIIDEYLKEQKIRYSISDQDSRGCVYELFIGSTSGFLQIEYNLDDTSDDYVVVQLFSPVDDHGGSIYQSEWDNDCEHCDSIEGEIDNLIMSVKRINQGIAKIASKIEQIRALCVEFELDFDELMTLNYDFDE